MNIKTIEIDGLIFTQPKISVFNKFMYEETQLEKVTKQEENKPNDLDLIDTQFDIANRFVSACLKDESQREELQKNLDYNYNWAFDVAKKLVAIITEKDEKQSTVIDEALKGSATTDVIQS